MKFYSIAILWLITINITAQEFEVRPYPLINEKSEILINFKLKEDSVLKVSNSNKQFFDHLSEYKKYQKNELHKINLGSLKCNYPKSIEITEQISQQIIYQATLPEALCKKETNNLNQKKSDKYSFGFMSDTQEFKDRHSSISNIIRKVQKKNDLDFILNAGDVVQEGDVEQQWIDFFDVSTSYLYDTPIIAALGNHDYRGSKGLKVPELFKKYLRWEKSDRYGNMSLNLDSLKIVVLNSNFFRMKKEQEKSILIWLSYQLRSAYKEKKPVILVTHFPFYSSSINRFTSMAVQKLRSKVVPLIEKYKVKVVFSGHTHMYERSIKNGVNYIVAGPAGGRINSPTWKNKYSVYLNQDILTFSHITVENNRFYMETYSEKNKVVDQISIDLL
tara:strand:- start:145183 stop:146349 length:1167 start_codon:yes stop_codon:yes gene_type:complete